MHRDNALAISDLESETQIMISLRHRSILRVLGVGKTGGLSVEPVSNCHLAWVLTGATPTRPARPLRGPTERWPLTCSGAQPIGGPEAPGGIL